MEMIGKLKFSMPVIGEAKDNKGVWEHDFRRGRWDGDSWYLDFKKAVH